MTTTADDRRLELLAGCIRDVPDFPKPGILFKDITPLVGNGEALRAAISLFVEKAAAYEPDAVVAIESRGFIFGGALAERLGIGFVPVRKPGKLPYKKARVEYSLEYGKDALEMHEDGVAPGSRVLILDDLLATGGTARAAAELVEARGAKVAAFFFVVELAFLEGRKRLDGYDVAALLAY